MSTIHSLHAELSRAYGRATAALDTFAASLEALPGAEASKPAPAKPAKPKPRKPAKPAHQAQPSTNGRYPVVEVEGAGF